MLVNARGFGGFNSAIVLREIHVLRFAACGLALAQAAKPQAGTKVSPSCLPSTPSASQRPAFPDRPHLRGGRSADLS